MRFWLPFVLLFPLLLWQGIRTRKTAIRLPEASGETSGLIAAHHSGKTVRLHIVGESPVAGVGVKQHRDGIGPALAKAVSDILQQPVHWQVSGKNGATLSTLMPILPPLETRDLTLIMMGINDTTHFSSRKQWRVQLQTLHNMLRPQGEISFFTLPPLKDFTALPQPLRYVMGQRAAQLNNDLRAFCRQHKLPFIDYQSPATRQYLAEDGYHPSALGYQAIAQHVSEQISGLIQR